MKKLLTLSLILSFLFLYGCSASNKASDDHLFQKKQECAKYTNQIKEDLLKDINEIYTDDVQVFYSPQRDSCIKSLKRDFHTHFTLRIDDLLTNENISLCYSNDANCESNVNSKLKELKGE